MTDISIDPDVGCIIPAPGSWPISPQEDVVPITATRLWVDGCFDFFHHGHAGLLLQSRRLCTHLTIGLHSDEAITHHKGPPVMTLAERCAAVNASRFSSLCVPDAPYVTSLPWVDHYGCWFVGHGDDVTSDVDGEDCYRFVKRAGRMKIVSRTEGISTTDLVGRMLEGGSEHHVTSLLDDDAAEKTTAGWRRRLKDYASAPNGLDPYVQVHTYSQMTNTFTSLVPGLPPRPGQRIVYLDGAFDLFSSGHIAFLALVTDLETAHGESRGWNEAAARERRIHDFGEDYPPAYVIAGIHDDAVVNKYRGGNYPIMNVFERGLCVVQCRYIHAVIFSAPAVPGREYLSSLPTASMASGSDTAATRYPDAVYHGPFLSPSSSNTTTTTTTNTTTTRATTTPDSYAAANDLKVFITTLPHAFQDVNAAQIVSRILDKRAEYEERQRKKGVKGVGEREREVAERLDVGKNNG